VAYFWRVDPAMLLALPLSRYDLYASQAERLSKLINPTE
jgi:hypothetical protein